MKQKTPFQAYEYLRHYSDVREWFDGSVTDYIEAWGIVETALKALEAIQTTAVMNLCMSEVKADHKLIEELNRVRKESFETGVELMKTKKELKEAHQEIQRLRDTAYPRNPSGE